MFYDKYIKILRGELNELNLKKQFKSPPDWEKSRTVFDPFPDAQVADAPVGVFPPQVDGGFWGDRFPKTSNLIPPYLGTIHFPHFLIHTKILCTREEPRAA
jgi:hypothetical protein